MCDIPTVKVKDKRFEVDREVYHHVLKLERKIEELEEAYKILQKALEGKDGT